MGRKNQTLLLAERIAKQLVAEQTKARLSLCMDAAIIAAHEALGMGPGRAEAFRKAYCDALDELAGMFIEDADENGDKQIEVAKYKRDEVIRKIVGNENFVPFDRSYGWAYMDELMRIRVKEDKHGQ